VLAAAPMDPAYASPGVLGFLAIFFVALATLLLMRSMTRHLRKVRYGPGPDGEPPVADPPPADAAKEPGPKGA